MRRELTLVLGEEKSLYVTILVYTLFISLANISIPISIQALVNVIPSTLMYYPLILLALIVLILLTASMVIYAMQKFVTELFKRRIFVRLSSLIMTRALYFEKKTMQSSSTEQLFDRFFEIPNIQSSTTSVIVGAFSAAVQMAIAIAISSFYHPLLLVFNLLLSGVIYYILRFHGEIAIKTAIKESSAKYETASWISEVGRKYLYMKSSRARDYATKKANTLIANYISARKKHFSHLFTQIIYLLIVYAFGNVMLLLICGFLVLEEKLTLGQFVATEVLFAYTFGHVLRIGNYLESFYKLIASCNKISHFYKIPLEDYNSRNANFAMDNIQIHNMSLPHINKKINLDLNLDGSYYAFMNFHEKTKRSILSVLMGWNEEFCKHTKIGEYFFNEINLDKYRDKVAFIDSSNILCTKVKEFTTINCPTVSHSKFEAIIRLVGLYNTISQLPEKEHTQIVSSKYPFNKEEVVQLKLAKALLEENKLIIIDYPIADSILFQNKSLMDFITNNPDLTIIHFTESEQVLPFANHIYKYDAEYQNILKEDV